MPLHPSTGRKRPPALRDVADLAGVSIKTVSNVVNDYPHVKDSTREKVREAILQVGYRPQVAAQQLRTGASKMVTLAVPALTFSYFSDLAQQFIDEAQLRGQTVVLHSTSGGREAERTVLEGFNRVVGDGVIFNPLLIEEDVFARMERTTQPTVFIGEHLPEKLPQGSDYVRIDNVAAAFEATTHLLDTGRRRIAFLGAIATRHGLQPHSSGNLRRDGYRAALRQHGVDPEEDLVQAVADWHRHDGFSGAAELMARRPDLDAIVCGNDDLAIGVLAQLRRLGRRVPEDIAVVGYDDTPDAPFASPPLTTISPDKHSLAATALDLLTERIQGHDGPPRILDTPYSLVIRESTGPATASTAASVASSAPDAASALTAPSTSDLEEHAP
ncbi:LacI family DNA-binding transcriptional regulator [Brachybacterium alimentarium]|uniref:LacI family DNA-binding transcriptional regulator n=1 Tax=Brachybacterium alimentarium TaxID=47845 RepID=UPI003FB79AA9